MNGQIKDRVDHDEHYDDNSHGL
jgi:hypothetical protein